MIQNESLVSVIVPVYKVENYLDRCVESIVNQTYVNLEIILVDDGSPDNCPAMCDKWAKKDGRIKVIHKKNDGLANARNSGIEACSGDYVLFADSDDYIEPDNVEFLLGLSLKYDVDVSRCGFYMYDERDGSESVFGECSEVKLPDSEELLRDLLLGGHVSGVAWNKLYKRDVIKSHPYKKEDGCSEDIMHNYRVYKDIKAAVFCDKPKYHYVIRADSITNAPFAYGAFDIIKAKKTILNNENGNMRGIALKSYIMSAFIVLSGCIRSNMFPKEQTELINSIISERKIILHSSLYSKSEKLKTLLLWLLPGVYRQIIKRK